MKSSSVQDINDETVYSKLLQKMNSKNEKVKFAFDIFKENYGSSVKETIISDIINGDTIKIKPENILIDKDIKFEDETFDKKMKYCTKTLYGYQRNAIMKLRELELRGWCINDHTKEKIISNGYLLSLPIGSGKSLVFQFLALFYRTIPENPIIISTEGNSVPIYDQLQWNYYPYFYEKCGYIEGDVNAVQVIENYKQRNITVILTHSHLLQQMKEYFETDFDPRIIRQTNIQYCMTVSDCNFNTADIIVIPATQANVQGLCDLSYAQPFMRVIIDDYTSMQNLDTFRQILATSTIFVSGSGFNRKEENIPVSYYSLKNTPSAKLSLVGKPDQTFEGVFRNSIATMELMGTNCEFSQYEFVSECESVCRQRFSANPVDLYPILEKQPLICNYMTLMFIIQNIEKIKASVSRIENDIANNTIDQDKIKYYLEWKNSLPKPKKDLKQQSAQTKQSLIKSGNYQARAQRIPFATTLYEALYSDGPTGNTNSIPIVMQTCMVCQSDYKTNAGYGAVSCCCGAFYCYKCLDSMCTHTIIDTKSGKRIIDNDNYYCCCCRKKNCKYYMNCTKMKDRSIYSFSLIEDFFEDAAILKNNLKVDYYFYMFLHGLKPSKHNGKFINIQNDVEHGIIDLNSQEIPVMETLLPRDQLAVLALESINETLGKLKICPRRNTYVLFYKCPQYMQNRVIAIHKKIIADTNPSTMVEFNVGSVKKMIQPVQNLEIVFRDSVDTLIGAHQNVLAIISWKKCETQDGTQQIFGRLYRLNNFVNDLYFYISTSVLEYA